jgi:prevent-host-death family protein
MATFNVAEAKTHFSALIQRALMGEEVIIARDNKPVLRLVPLKEARQPRQPGSARGEVWLAADFEETPEGFEEYQ